MSQSLVMEAEATPWGPGEGEAALPLEKQGHKSSRSPGRGDADEQVWEPDQDEGPRGWGSGGGG